MKNSVSTSILIFCLFNIIGCADTSDSAADNVIERQYSEAELTKPRQHFNGHFNDARRYGELLKNGILLRENKQYEEALDSFKTALNQHAAMRNEQATASDQIAITLEAMGNYQEAAKYYDLAAELTMNENRKVSLSEKAQALRQKQ